MLSPCSLNHSVVHPRALTDILRSCQARGRESCGLVQVSVPGHFLSLREGLRMSSKVQGEASAMVASYRFWPFLSLNWSSSVSSLGSGYFSNSSTLVTSTSMERVVRPHPGTQTQEPLGGESTTQHPGAGAGGQESHRGHRRLCSTPASPLHL